MPPLRKMDTLNVNDTFSLLAHYFNVKMVKYFVILNLLKIMNGKILFSSFTSVSFLRKSFEMSTCILRNKNESR